MPALNSPQIHYIRRGDTLRPIGVQFKRADGSLVSLVGASQVTFQMMTAEGVDVVAATNVGVSVVDGAAGKAQYDFQPDAPAVQTPGTFHIYWRVYFGSEWESFPPDGAKMLLIIT